MVFLSILKRFYFLLLTCSVCFLSCSKEFTSPELYKSMQIADDISKDIPIDSVIKLAENSQNFKPLENRNIYILEDEKVAWLFIQKKSLKESKYLSIWSPYTDYSKPYIIDCDSIIELNTISLLDNTNYNSNYRFPSWKLPQLNNEVDIFIKIIDFKRATGFKILFQNENEFFTFTKLDYFKITLISILLFSMMIIVLALFMAKKQMSLIWYALYIFVFILEFYISQGIDLELELFSSSIIHSLKKVFLQSLGGVFAGLFFVNFYTFTKEVYIVKYIFKALVYVYLISALLIISFVVVNDIYIPKSFIWIPQRITILIVLLAHFYLIKKDKIPAYLGISFTFPITGYFIFVFLKQEQDWNLLSYFLVENALHYAMILEIVFMLYYIINQLVKSDMLAIQLNKENLKLRSSFQENILDAQEKERSTLLSNVHDTFGGYLEALKIRLLQKNNNPEKIQEILDAFYNEYRYLLNSLYSPKINSSNFIESLTEFFIKINKLVDNKIKYQFQISEIQLSQEQCLHLYRIVSELLTNSIKYAKASIIEIEMEQLHNNFLLLKVKDDGIGFERNKSNFTSYGLQNIKERTKQMNGIFNLQTKKNIGTTALVKIPLNETKEN